MHIRRGGDIPASQITPESVYLDRRAFVAAAGGVALGALLPPRLRALAGPDDLKPTPYDTITTYNNYYEFGTSKESPAKLAGRLKTSPWTVEVSGAAKRTGRHNSEDLVRPFTMQERIYRHRCVEGWSMVVPWMGFPLGDLIRRLARLAAIDTVAGDPPAGSAQAVVDDATIALPLAGIIDLDVERDRLRRENERLVNLVTGAERKLGNADFVGRAKPEVVEREREKLLSLKGDLERVAAALADLT